MHGHTRPGECILKASELVMDFGTKRVLDGIDMQLNRGEILAVVGGSGSGKSTLMRQLALLQAPTAGKIQLFGMDVTNMGELRTLPLRRQMGVMFQHGALFGDLTVLENVSLPLREHTDLTLGTIEEISMLKIVLAGLEPDAAALYPSQLSGGMRKRAAVARGIALDPEILFLDEPSSGLDPISANAMDELVLHLKKTLGLTILLVTHDMDSLWRVADRILLLAEAKVAAEGSLRELVASDNAHARGFFQGPRGRAAGASHDQ
ncbi:MAG: ATP-binding cassette domain-containing protein [Xanthomonadales bacterium]|nr:ATP-binding cassette domain-containing protein [Xanthomonadales bacterium]